MSADNFLDVPFTVENLDRYYIRTSILKALQDSISHFNGKLLDIGCGKMPYKNYILENSSVFQYTGLDVDNALEYDAEIKPDYTWDGIRMPFEDGEFQTVFATEVLEHCPYPKILLDETYRVMKNEGCFFFTVPFLWNLHEVPHDEYRYTPFALQRLLVETGFKNINIKATGGWHASMAQMLGLWVRRSQMTEKKRSILSGILKPVIKKLIKIDKHSPIAFKEGQMITGLYAVAFK